MAESRRSRRMIENTAQIRLGISARLRDAGQDAWLAGLNFVAKAQDDTHRALESFAANAVFTGFAEKVVAAFGSVALRTQANADALLGRAGVASHRDIDALSRRVSKLAKEVEKLAVARRGAERPTRAMTSRVPG